MRKTQAEIDRAYKLRQASRGIVKKTVQVPLERWPELQSLAKEMRDAQKSPDQKTEADLLSEENKLF
tara:strand:- start:1336 stop:1536 length:201 start_codon:yes stop_codon:yes gene_type:complete